MTCASRGPGATPAIGSGQRFICKQMTFEAFDNGRNDAIDARRRQL
jgi:hypothetical protein